MIARAGSRTYYIRVVHPATTRACLMMTSTGSEGVDVSALNGDIPFWATLFD